MKKTVVIDDNGQGFERLEMLLSGQGFSVAAIYDENEKGDASAMPNRNGTDLFETAPIGICRSTSDGKLVDVNPAMARLLRYDSSEDMIRIVNCTNMAEAVYVSPGCWEEIIKCAEASSDWHVFEEMFRCKDGSVITCNFHFREVRGRIGESRQFEAFMEDIAVRKEAEESLRLSQFIIDNASIGISLGDSEARILSVNDYWAKKLGYSREELCSMTYFDIDPDLTPEFWHAHRQKLMSTGFNSFESHHRRKDGTIFPVQISVNYLTFGDRTFSCSFTMDMTARKQAEEALRQANRVVESSPMVLFRWKAAAGWPVEMVSNNVSRFGYEPEELLSGRVLFSSLVYSDDLERVAAEVEEYCRRGEDRFQQEFRIVTKEGEVVWVDDRTVLERDDGGRITHFQGILIDITERKRTEMVLSARVRLLQFAATHSLEDLLQATLDEAEKLTGSCVGFYHYLEADQKTLSLQNWSTRTKREFCKAEGKGLHYNIDSAGVWVDCIHQRRPVIHNDYVSLPHRKGLPPGHAPVVRELVVPVFRGGSIEAIFGVGNKPHNYTDLDVETVSLLADLAWGVVGLKRAEAALGESEKRYRAIIEHAPFGIVRATREGKLLNANPAFAGILKYDSTEELMDSVNRTSVHEALFVKPSDRDTIVERIFSGNTWHVFDNQYRCKDGSIITCKVHSRRVPALNGNDCEFESFLENITERLEAEQALRESEEKFRVLAETSPTAIALYQGEGLVYINPTASRLIGYSVEELSAFSFWDCVHDDFRELVRERGLARMRGEALPEQYECKFVTKDGRELWALMTIGRIEYKGKPAGIVTLIDTTEAKLADERIRASLAEKEVLLKEVHHRVKNNLQIISSLLDLQSDYLRDEQSRAVIRESQNRIRSMALIHQKLYQSESFAFVNFREYIEELVTELFVTYAKEPDLIKLNVDVGEVALGMDEAIPCGLIVNELVSNSLKHAFPHGRSGDVTVKCHIGADSRVELTIADTGIGLPPGLDLETTGTLGLQLVSMLVKQLRGELLVDSASAMFVVRFKRFATQEKNRQEHQRGNQFFRR